MFGCSCGEVFYLPSGNLRYALILCENKTEENFRNRLTHLAATFIEDDFNIENRAELLQEHEKT